MCQSGPLNFPDSVQCFNPFVERRFQYVGLRSMGTQVHNKDYFPGHHSMRDLNGNASSSNWPIYYSDRTLANGQYCSGFISRNIPDANNGYEKDSVKQTIIEHEAVFKNQVTELHRLYRTQRDMMEEAKRRELRKHWMPMELSSSSSILGSDAQKWQTTYFPLANSCYDRPAASSTDIVNSPLSCTKGNDIQSGQVPLQNGYSSKHCEVLDSRPSKVRKKLFDLELPADEYTDIEEVEHLHDSKESFHPRNSEITQQSSVKLFLHGHGETDCRKDALASNSCLRRGNELADLNEPAQLEEATTQSPLDFLSHCNSHTKANSSGVACKPNPFLANKFLSNLSVESQRKERESLLYTYEPGHVKRNLSQAPEGLEQNKLHIHPHPAEGILGRPQQLPGIHPTHGIMGEKWREKTACGLQTFDKSHNNSNNSYAEPLATSVFSCSHPHINSSEFANSWSHSLSAWGKPISSLTEKVASFHKNPCLSSASALGSVGDNKNGSSRVLNPGCSSDVPLRNGFYHGSSGLRDPSARFPSGLFNNLKNGRGDYMSSKCSTNHWHEKFLVSSNSVDSKSTKDFDLNEVISVEDDEGLVENKHKLRDSASTLCWLRDEPGCKNMGKMPNSDFGFIQSSSNPPFRQSNNLKHGNETFSQNATFSERNIEAKEVGETQCAKKILGVQILEFPFASKNESSSHISTSVTIPSSTELRRNEKLMIDINVACDLSESDEKAGPETLVAEKGLDSEPTGVRNHFDLNSCITEEDDALGPSAASNDVKTRVVLEIDLEAPFVMDSDEDNPPIQENNQHYEASLDFPEHKAKNTEDEFSQIAAEAIVAISSGQCIPTENTSEDSFAGILCWFADVVSSCADELNLNPGKGNLVNEQSSYGETDYFEVMTLQLTETKEEEYMPKPFIPEFGNMEDTNANSVPTRTRRGPARRGRQKRDFQRDILPSLTSLSRHEVSEDFQTFGKLMSPLTRRTGTRNGGARGRPRNVVVQTEPTVVSNPNLMERINKGGLEDKNLTGWGKTTRRPRRQRCPPAGNPPIATLT